MSWPMQGTHRWFLALCRIYRLDYRIFQPDNESFFKPSDHEGVSLRRVLCSTDARLCRPSRLGYSESSQTRQCTVFQTFLNAVNLENGVLLNGLRQYLHRMVICLETELLPHLGGVVRKFLCVASDVKSLQDFLILLQQATSKFKVCHRLF